MKNWIKGYVRELCVAVCNAGRIPAFRAYVKGLLLILVAGLVWMGLPAAVQAAPDACVVSPAGTVTCAGNQSQGIASGIDFFTPPITTLNVNSLSGAIAPASGTEGIGFRNTTGSSLTLNIGNVQDYLGITTTNASGITASGKGVTGAEGVDGWVLIPFGPVPTNGGTGSNGGSINIIHYGGITTLGDFSAGIMAVSEGGTGGEGGYGGDYYNGRQGGTGGTGGTIKISGTGTIHTYNTSSSGIAALSLGGAGGAGGGASGAMSGGSGGFGGQGGTVNVDGDWTITTEANKSHGIWAKSLGGSSGAGGSGGWLFGNPGAGGEASNGGSISVTSGGHIATHGNESYGIYAQSIGGFGGSGGSNFNLFWSFGGDGGSAGSGGSVSVTNETEGSIRTYGSSSHAIVAQSIGGGGGGGGGNFAIIVSVGGDGGAGGDGGGVSVLNQGDVETHGASSRGVLAQSIGGGGGDSGSSLGLISVGGNASEASHGGSVTVDNSGMIRTGGTHSDAIFAESIGGGGGTGSTIAGAITVGGFGAGGGGGGSVAVTNSGDIDTEAASSRGIYAHSIGGGGGSGGGAYGVVSVGGAGSGGGAGGDVTVSSSGSINTLGSFSDGIYAQSVGGGGGGGFGESFSGAAIAVVSIGGYGTGGGAGGAVQVSNSGTVETAGSYANGLFAQSVGGGGGIAHATISNIVSIGGRGGSGGSGGLVAVTNGTGASIITHGDSGHGIVAQSIGGGGGSSGYNFSGIVTVGGGGGNSGDGGSVNVTNNGSVTTEGKTSRGIYAQSIGGGGGSIFTDEGALDLANAAFDAALLVTIGSEETSTGDGGSVTINSSGSITTKGEASEGIYAQSIGGGGGSGSFIIGAFGVEVDTNVGNDGGGTGGAVDVTNSGTIVTEGDSSDAIFAQSVGGGGGDGRTSLGVVSLSYDALIGGVGGGVGGAVTVSNSGSITTQGDNSRGIFAQSVGGSGGRGTSVLTGSVGIQVSGSSALGGAGGNGGNGSAVSATNSGSILTVGSGSDAIFAQSIGGGGGEGGTSMAASAALSLLSFFNLNQSISIGGSGGAGGSGSTVNVENSGCIDTRGSFSNAILGQSVGGGGGSGGHSINATLSVNTNFNRDIGIGGTGGDGGDGATVTLSSSNGTGIYTQSDFSNGIFGQSVGGGGGSGGTSLLASTDLKIFLPEIPGADQIPKLDVTGALTTTVGGTGGGGGTGGSVAVENGSSIVTLGDYSNAMLLQSVGGGGGSGGHSVYVTSDINVMSATIPTEWKDFIGIPAIKGTYASSVGGTGGGGGSGGAVDMDNSGSIATAGDNADGILAQSIGGGGGTGGTSITMSSAKNAATISVKLAPDVNVSYTSSVGGSGGTGGVGGTVNVDSSGSILTQGNNSDGIVAQSVGGGGGSGGSSTTFSSELSVFNFNAPNINVNISESLGGLGETGGIGGAVVVDNSGLIETHGVNAHCILAQSIGGGGGTGGSSTNTSSGLGILTLETFKSKISYSRNVGGSGDNGGNGGSVSVDNSGTIGTFGDESIAILAQSIGGGGGSGGDSHTVSTDQGYVNSTSPVVSVSVESSVGGSGGSGGSGSTVNVTNSGEIYTQGSDSGGIVAQSVGGGGGNGGSSIAIKAKQALLNTILPRLEAGYSGSIGGQGGAGGVGGDVSVMNSGTIWTIGINSSCILAQSVGGGGGTGGSRITADVDGTLFEIVPTAKVSGTILQSLGGNGGTGNNGGSAAVENIGRIATQGEYSHGMMAQSVGGGGGIGGSSIGVNVDATQIDMAPTLELSGTFESSVGGTGGAAGNGGETSATNSGLISTAGAFASGIVAQSVGGGGGAGGVTLDVSADMNSLSNVPNLMLKVEGQMSITLGGEGGAGGSGGNVTVANSGGIITGGDFAPAIFAQSVGGGGGLAGYAATVSATAAGSTLEDLRSSIAAGSLAIGLRSNAGSAGDGGTVTVTNSSPLITLGAYSPGIVAQSVGGGGGIAGISNQYGVSSAALGAAAQGSLLETAGVGLWFAGSVGGAGSAGNVAVTNSGNIITLDVFSHGIFAQSAGGTGSGGTVSVTHSGNVLAEGADSDGILAQSIGGSGRGNISVNITAGIISGGTGNGAGVRLIDGAQNTVNNYGTIRSNAGIDGMAISGTTGHETINNYGVISGNLDLGSGLNGVATNAAGATFNSGASVLIGAGNLLSNSGTLAPGGMNLVHTSNVTGSLVQSASGTYAVDLDLGNNTADLVTFTGTSLLSGSVAVSLLNPALMSSGSHEVTILSSASGATSFGLVLNAPSSLVMQYQLLYPNANDVVLGYTADFNPVRFSSTMSGNQGSVGDYINRALSGGGAPALAPLIGSLFSLTDISQFRWAYDRLSPEPYLSDEAGTFFSTFQFHDAMLSCREREGSYRFVSDRSCGWFRMNLQRFEQKSSDEYFGFKRDAFRAAGGGQVSVNDNWHVGAALSYEHSLTSIRDFAESEGDQIQAGVVAKGRFGATTVSVSAGGGYSWYDMTREVDLPVPGTRARGSHSVTFAASHVRVGHAFTFGSWYLRPIIDGGVTYVKVGDVRENGAGPLSLNVRSHDSAYVSIQPAVEVGGEWRPRGDTLFRPFGKFGVTRLLSGTGQEIAASFAGDTSGVSPVTIKSRLDDTLVDVAVGLDIVGSKGTTLRVAYSGQFAKRTEGRSISLKLSIPF